QGSLSETGKYRKNPTYDRNHRSDLTVLRTPAEWRDFLLSVIFLNESPRHFVALSPLTRGV
ncbi:MAG: hypothetical protein IJD62_00225, partial [Oscillospiraceae bacterium]|nr:hypothetical protein [Oscillospiraceae bacterium]